MGLSWWEERGGGIVNVLKVGKGGGAQTENLFHTSFLLILPPLSQIFFFS